VVQSDNATEPLGRLLRMWARVTMDRFRHSSPSTINRFEKHGASARLVELLLDVDAHGARALVEDCTSARAP
jgi:hypothetical protein